MQKEIILASKSPRRQELLKWVIPTFQIVTSEFDETKLMESTLHPDELVQQLAFYKAKSVHDRLKSDNAIIISGDTIVLSPQNRIFGIPKNRDDAREMLCCLSANVHKVLTGVVIYGKSIHSFVETTEVQFYPLKHQEIEDYLDSGEPFDKAGAYGIQGGGSLLVKEIHGDYFNVVGFPVSRFKREFEKFLSLPENS